jgi:hypothetical protein
MVSIGKWLLYGLVGAFAVSALVDPARAQGTIGAFSGVGTALGSLGGGIQSLLTGTGTGVSKLFNPLFTLRDLIYGPQAGVQVEKDIYQVSATGNLTTKQIPYEVEAIQLDPAAPFTPVNTGFGGVPLSSGFSYRPQPSISPVPVAQAVVHGQSLPLSQAAIKHYQALGVAVSPESSETVAAQNSGNATSNRSASATYRAGNAQAAGFSTGRPR